ncbi:MAG: acylneuraminate cytidylyltransferase family protein [Planctomycetes bacterium]|nr:acylneuraminate cytidylyltransferase family protein [Planctomycetota bacterium]
MNIVCLIPARAGSKGIPDKNILDLNGFPLIAYSIAAARLSRHIGETVVTTDSTVIADVARSYGASVPFLRPTELARDDSLDIEFFRHYLDWLEAESIAAPDLIVHLRPTTPLREAAVIDAAIEYMLGSGEATALRSMHPTRLTPYKMFGKHGQWARAFLDRPGVAEPANLPRQAFEDAYIPNGYVDIIRPCVLQRTGLLHGERIKLWVTEQVADIDLLEDHSFASNLLRDDRFKILPRMLEESQWATT